MWQRALTVSGGGGGSISEATLNFTINPQGADIKVCKLTTTSSGSVTFQAGSGYSDWSINGKTVTKTGGGATSIAYYVTGDYLYAHNQSSANVANYTGNISSCDPMDTDLTPTISLQN